MTTRSRSAAAKHAADEAPEAPEAPVEAPEEAKEAEEAHDGVSADVKAVREAHANQPVIQALDARVDVDQPVVLESLSAERRRLQVEAIEKHGLAL